MFFKSFGAVQELLWNSLFTPRYVFQATLGGAKSPLSSRQEGGVTEHAISQWWDWTLALSFWVAAVGGSLGWRQVVPVLSSHSFVHEQQLYSEGDCCVLLETSMGSWRRRRELPRYMVGCGAGRVMCLNLTGVFPWVMPGEELTFLSCC